MIVIGPGWRIALVRTKHVVISVLTTFVIICMNVVTVPAGFLAFLGLKTFHFRHPVDARAYKIMPKPVRRVGVDVVCVANVLVPENMGEKYRSEYLIVLCDVGFVLVQ